MESKSWGPSTSISNSHDATSLWEDPSRASALGGQFNGWEEHTEVGEDPLPTEGGHRKSEDALAAADSVEGDLSYLVVQVDPNLPIEKWDRGVGWSCEGNAELIILLQAPNFSVGLEEDPAFPLNWLTGHSHGPEAPIGLHLPVVPTRGEALAAQHAWICVKPAWALRPLASRSAPGGFFEVLREDHLWTHCGWIQGYVHWKAKQRTNQKPNLCLENTHPQNTFTGGFPKGKGEERWGWRCKCEEVEVGDGGYISSWGWKQKSKDMEVGDGGGPRETEGGVGESPTSLNISAQRTQQTDTLLLSSHSWLPSNCLAVW